MALWGLAPEVAIGEVDWNDFLTAVESYMTTVLECGAMLHPPFLAVLNLCRWQMKRRSPDKIVPSKEEGGEWALTYLSPETWGIINQALAAYRLSEWPKDAHERRLTGGLWDPDELLAFRDIMRMSARKMA